MVNKIEEILEQLKTLTLVEASELVSKMEEVFGIDLSITNSLVTSSTDNNSKTEETVEKTEFNLILEEVPAPKKIAILKVVRSLTSLGLKEAKDLVESAPKQVKENVSKEIAENGKKLIEEAGGKASIK